MAEAETSRREREVDKFFRTVICQYEAEDRVGRQLCLLAVCVDKLAECRPLFVASGQLQFGCKSLMLTWEALTLEELL